MKIPRLVVRVVLLGVWATGGAQAACSAWMDKAFLNEYYFGPSGNNFLEIFSEDPAFSASAWSNWTIDVYDGKDKKDTYSKSNATQSTCSSGAKIWGVLEGDLKLEASHALVILRDGNGDPVDVMVFDNGSPPSPWKSAADNYFSTLSTQCPALATRLSSQAAESEKPYHGQNMIVLDNAGNKDIGRVPDGAGLWSNSGLTGANTTTTKCSSNNPATPAVDHYEIDVPNVGLTCQSSTINVRACATSAAPCTASLASTASTTTLSASSGSFVNAGGATQTFTGSTAYTLSATAPATVTVGMTAPATTPTCYRFDGSTRTLLGSCTYDVKTAIFQFDVPNFEAGNGSGPVTISALRQDDATKKCVSFVPSGSVKLWTTYSDPNSGSKPASLTYATGSYTLPTSKPGVGNVPLAFDANGQASIALDYLDAGLLRLDAEWNTVTGNDSFVVKPYFSLAGISCADGTVNPGAANAGGARFCRAGQSFSATINAVAKDGTTATPNFGKESSPEGARLTAALVAPAGGSAGSMSGAVGGFSDTGGARQASASYSWSEVGIVSLVPGIADGDYLGAGDVTGSAVSPVGRFFPDHFDIAVTTQCSGFTYGGQPGSPVVTGQPITVQATARNASGGTTTNYNTTAGFSKAVNLSLPVGGTVGKLYVDAVQGGNGAIPATKFAAGIGQVNYNDASGKISYVFDTFPSALTAIAIHGEDADTASGTALMAGGNGTTTVRAGRLQLSNAYGSELLPLGVPAKVQSWTATGWVGNVADSCTALTVPTAGNGGLTNTLSTKTTATLASPVVAGDLRLRLATPGAGNTGLVDIIGSVLRGTNTWLALPAPFARACFGVCGPRSPVIYSRENY